ncbi:MAG TPA: methylenetetrahydrofolate reductase [Dehalococcoidia bacterium]|nr:methylenetetrahydrofolate reductase [Dehalococcoidia bacterium]
MEVASLYANPRLWPVFSAETFPTENFRPIDPILKTVEELLPYIQVVTTTWGALGSPRGGTPSVSRIIHEKFEIPTVVHLSIQAKTKRDMESILRGLHLDGLNNVLALGGDPPAGVVDYVPAELRHRYASGLVEQIAHMNAGLWMDAEGKYTRTGVKTRFGIGVAGFPEIHPDDFRADESLELNMKRNIEHLKIKVDAGADYIVEQMIFDADLHFRFAEAAHKAGIRIPIIPGILPFDRYGQAARFIGEELRISMPVKIQAALEAASEDDQGSIAAEYMSEQVRKILDSGVPGIHFYCMNRSGPTIELLRRIGS